MTCNACGGPLETALPDVEDPQTREHFSVRRCASCGLGHTAPVPDDLAPYYGLTYHGKRHGSTLGFCLRRRVRFVESVARPEPGDRLLDVGCGDGSFLAAARDAGWTVAGTELYPEQAREAGFDVRTSVAEVEDFGPVRVATMWHTLEHMVDPRDTISRVARTLAPGGVAFVAVPDFGGLQARAFGARWAHLDVPRHLYHFDRGSLASLLESVGLRPETWWHQELEYDLFGLAQSASNAVLPHPNVFYDRVTGKPPKVGKGLDLAALALGAGLTAVTAPLVPIASALGQGGTLVVAARRAEGDRDRTAEGR